MITDNLTNAVYFSSLLPEKCPVLNAHITEALQKRGIVYGYLPGTKDIWCRDYMPIQIEREHFVQYKYTPDYLQNKIGLPNCCLFLLIETGTNMAWDIATA